MRRPALPVLAALLALNAAAAHAHTVGVSRGDYRVSGATVRAELVYARLELAGAVAGLDADRDGSVSEAEAESARRALAAAIVGRLEVRGQDGACEGALEDASLVEQDGLVVRAVFTCGMDPSALSIRLGFLDSLSMGHRHIASVTKPGGQTERIVVYEGRPEFHVELRGAGAEAAGGLAAPLFRLGIQHILTGYDHLLFLVGLILVGGRLRPLLVAVTAFTVAHSVTLGLAVLGAWAPSPRVVEPAIALSIVYVGIENCFVRDAGRRWLVTFPFGLVHGFGFAGALREISLPSTQIPLALASFNLGVEAGQVAVLIFMLPLVRWLQGRSWFADRGVKSLSAAIAIAGLVWFVGRLG